MFSVASKPHFWICLPVFTHNDSAGREFTVWLKGPSAGSESAVGHGGCLAGDRDAVPSRLSDQGWRIKRKRVTSCSEFKSEPEADDARRLQTHLSGNLQT